MCTNTYIIYIWYQYMYNIQYNMYIYIQYITHIWYIYRWSRHPGRIYLLVEAMKHLSYTSNHIRPCISYNICIMRYV